MANFYPKNISKALSYNLHSTFDIFFSTFNAVSLKVKHGLFFIYTANQILSIAG